MCNNSAITTKLYLNGKADGYAFKVDTGMPASVISLKNFAKMTGCSLDVAKEFVYGKPCVNFKSFSYNYISVIPVVFRNAVIGFDKYKLSCIRLDEFMVFVTRSTIGNNTLGLDFISACSGTFGSGRMSVEYFNEKVYNDNFLKFCNGMKPYEVSELEKCKIARTNAVNSILSSAEGN